ncbi:PIN domain-containing protein [Mycolicibacterium goodii]|uniref:PIN domain-containing protein n=1 Tax=Mycolicibacterium goodii TaxID=134601 RepID=UPI0006731D69
MKSVLPEWYAHDDDTLRKILKSGTIAVDTNALLDLYRVGKPQRTEILGVLKAVRERLFVPYQVALEFHRNRLNVVRDTGVIYDKLASEFALKQELVDRIKDPRLKKEVRKLSDEVSDRFKQGLTALRTEHTLTLEVAKKSDPVLDELDSLLEASTVGARPKDDVLKERRTTAMQRITDKMPPGFADAKDKEDPTGDYLIWAELLDYARDHARPLLFVSNDDTKGDWYRPKISGLSLGPLPELVAEMGTVLPDHPYHQTNLASFLTLAKRHLGLSVEDETIDSVQRIEVYRAPDPDRRTIILKSSDSESLVRDWVKARRHVAASSTPSASEVDRSLAKYIAKNMSPDSDWNTEESALLLIKQLADVLRESHKSAIAEARDDNGEYEGQ